MRLRSVQPAGKPYRILIGMDTSADDEMLAPLRRRILYAWAASFLLAFLGGILLARRGLAPVAALSAGLRSIRPTHLDARLSTAELPRELLALGAEVNTMLARLEDAFGRLTQYSADIAHELRTPLNALHGTLEVALDRERNADDYRQTLNAAHEECTLLIRLSDDMLFLAQAENPRTHLRRETIHLHPFLETIKDLYAPSASETGITLATAVPPSLTVFADRILLQRVVVNLTANALAHTPPGGTITLFAEGTPGSILVGVRNSGNTIPVDERRAIFGRFHRGDRARTPQGGRVGLGLAIVKGIAELHGGTADAAESESGETVVRITLPHLAKVTASE